MQQLMVKMHFFLDWVRSLNMISTQWLIIKQQKEQILETQSDKDAKATKKAF